jgi:hypothetical protein
MHGAAGGLEPCGKERLDLLVGFVDCPGPPRLLIALATEPQRRLGERRAVVR